MMKELEKDINKGENSRTKLIIFDYDGVIVDTFPSTCKAYDEIFREFNITKRYEPEEFRLLFEADWRKFIARLGIIGEKNIEKTESIFRDVMQRERESIRVFPGIINILERLKKSGYQMVIVSNNYEKIIKEQIERDGMAHYFEHILDSLHGMKPDPAGVLVALEMLGVKPEEAIMIGDMDADIEAAKKAKLKKVIAVSWGYHHHSKLGGADIIVHTPEKLIEVIESETSKHLQR